MPFKFHPDAVYLIGADPEYQYVIRDLVRFSLPKVVVMLVT
jgi:hypothetical protein